MKLCHQLPLQIGRAGRNGSESFCHLFLDDSDFFRLRSLAHSDGIDASNARAFLEAVFEHQPAHLAGNTSCSRPEGQLEPMAGSEDAGPSRPVFGTLAVDQVAEACDMKEEVMETLLSYLEVGSRLCLALHCIALLSEDSI